MCYYVSGVATKDGLYYSSIDDHSKIIEKLELKDETYIRFEIYPTIGGVENTNKKQRSEIPKGRVTKWRYELDPSGDAIPEWYEREAPRIAREAIILAKKIHPVTQRLQTERDAINAKWQTERDALYAKRQTELDALYAKRQTERDAINAKWQTELDAINAKRQTELDALYAKRQTERDALYAKRQTELDAINAKWQPELDAINAKLVRAVGKAGTFVKLEVV